MDFLYMAKKLFSLSVPCSTRSDQIDLVRGWVMILVVMHHAAFLKQPDAFSSVCQSLILGFHMPFFFLLNGYLLHLAGSVGKYSVKRYLKTRFMRLLVPYFLFELVNLALSWLAMPFLHNHVELDKAFVSIIECVNDKTVYEGISGRLWFLPCLFFSDMLVFVSLKIIKGSKKLLALAALLVSASYAWHCCGGQRLPLTLDIALMGAFFVLVGYVGRPLYAKCAERESRWWWGMFFAVMVLVYGCSALCNSEDILMYDDRYGNYILAIAGAIAGFCLVMMLGRFFVSKVSAGARGILDWFRSLSLWYGINSLAVFPIHFWVVNILKYAMNTQPPYNCVLFILALFATIPLVNFVRDYMPFLLGMAYAKHEKV